MNEFFFNLYFLRSSQMLLFFVFIAFIIFLHVTCVCQLSISSLHRRPWQLFKKKKTLRNSLCRFFFFLIYIFNMLVEILFQQKFLGNLDTNAFLSREMIIYSYTLLPVIKPLPYLRQNSFHNNKETQLCFFF